MFQSVSILIPVRDLSVTHHFYLSGNLVITHYLFLVILLLLVTSLCCKHVIGPLCCDYYLPLCTLKGTLLQWIDKGLHYFCLATLTMTACMVEGNIFASRHPSSLSSCLITYMALILNDIWIK